MLFLLPILLSTFSDTYTKAQLFDPYGMSTLTNPYYGEAAASLFSGMYNPTLYNNGGAFGGQQSLLTAPPFDYNGISNSILANSFGGGQFNPFAMGTPNNPYGLMFTGFPGNSFNLVPTNRNFVQTGTAYGARRKHDRDGNIYGGGKMMSLYSGSDCNHYSKKGCSDKK